MPSIRWHSGGSSAGRSCGEKISSICPPTLPTIPPEIPQSAERLTIDGANAIERYLLNLGTVDASIRENYMYAGEIFAGEV